MSIVAITSARDLDRYRALRLEALATDPDAFGSTIDHETEFDDAEWARRMDSFRGEPGQILVATDDGRDIGVVGIGVRRAPVEHLATPSHIDAVLWGMWVRPADRGRGAARELIDAAIGWARRHDATDVVLAVRRDNHAAIELYRSVGFEDTDSAGLTVGGPCSGELEMRRPVG
ncbi:MAG: GNAT family N-acetyltransferase [Acidimicrobiales bacterium]